MSRFDQTFYAVILILMVLFIFIAVVLHVRNVEEDRHDNTIHREDLNGDVREPQGEREDL